MWSLNSKLIINCSSFRPGTLLLSQTVCVFLCELWANFVKWFSGLCISPYYKFYDYMNININVLYILRFIWHHSALSWPINLVLKDLVTMNSTRLCARAFIRVLPLNVLLYELSVYWCWAEIYFNIKNMHLSWLN